MIRIKGLVPAGTQWILGCAKFLFSGSHPWEEPKPRKLRKRVIGWPPPDMLIAESRALRASNENGGSVPGAPLTPAGALPPSGSCEELGRGSPALASLREGWAGQGSS